MESSPQNSPETNTPRMDAVIPPVSKIPFLKNHNKVSTIVVGVVVACLVVIAIVFIVLDQNKKRAEKEMINKSIESARWLESQVRPRTAEEDVRIAKELEKAAKAVPPPTEEKKKEIINFLNS